MQFEYIHSENNDSNQLNKHITGNILLIYNSWHLQSDQACKLF